MNSTVPLKKMYICPFIMRLRYQHFYTTLLDRNHVITLVFIIYVKGKIYDDKIENLLVMHLSTD